MQNSILSLTSSDIPGFDKRKYPGQSGLSKDLGATLVNVTPLTSSTCGEPTDAAHNTSSSVPFLP